MVTLEEVNKMAMKSCPRWNSLKLSRRMYRAKYRGVAEAYWNSPEHQSLIQQYKDGWLVDTYPWPYSDPGFANWEEDSSDEGYSLISDQSGCVVKYATSYVAWKIFEATGKWPQKTTAKRLDAKKWVQFLSEAGYKTIVKKLEPDGKYVGINPNIGKWGLVVWYEYTVDTPIEEACVSTYENKLFTIRFVRTSEYVWVKIR